MAINKPSWFSEDQVMISTAPTCGLTKGGRYLPVVDPNTGKRVQVLDKETGASIDAIDDKLLLDVRALREGNETDTLRHIPTSEVKLSCAVPTYYDRRFDEEFRLAMGDHVFDGFTSKTIGELFDAGLIDIRNGHGSPSQDERIGDVPYIKVSDLRAGLVNINPTNMIPLSVAERFWKGKNSGLQAFDLICPERTSKNIGDFCILLPGQERVVATKEVIVIRAKEGAPFDQFYLMWALSLKIVRNQWKRVVFMQTNREDVGDRFHEIALPIPPSRDRADKVSCEFRDYYQSLASARSKLASYLLTDGLHHFFLAGAPEDVSTEGEKA